MRWWVLTTVGIALIGIVVAAGVWMSGVWPVRHHASHEGGPHHALAPPGTAGGMSLTEALDGRRSVREYDAKPLSRDQIAQLCWAAQGVTDSANGLRTAPSAGALYPLELFVVDAAGVSQYEPRGHTIRELFTGDLRARLSDAALGQSCVGDAPVCFVIAMDVGRTRAKYGRRAERYCLLEAGHVAQNLLLQATALGLGGVPVGAFDEDKVSELLRLPGNLQPVYLIPVGHPARS